MEGRVSAVALQGGVEVEVSEKAGEDKREADDALAASAMTSSSNDGRSVLDLALAVTQRAVSSNVIEHAL